MHYIDSHCHLDFAPFHADLDAVIQRANQAGVQNFIVPGVKASQWLELRDLCDKHKSMFFSVGLHPYFLDQFSTADLNLLDTLLSSEQVVAVGECGIDCSISNLSLQQKVFAAQVELANAFKKPLIVHHRKSHHLIQQVFKQITPQHGGVIHAFSGSQQDAEKYINLGFKLGVGGTITYSRAEKTRKVIASVPLTSLLLETDSPDMPLQGYQGQRNEPYHIVEVAEQLATLRGITAEQVREQTFINTRTLFGI